MHLTQKKPITNRKRFFVWSASSFPTHCRISRQALSEIDMELEPMVVNREENEFICVTKWSLISQVRLIRSPVSGPETSPICRFYCYQRTKQSADTG